MYKILLSICIATRNRGAFIGATLESIISQATDQLEIVVLDGASSDNTEEVVKSCQERCPQLRFFRQETNRGIDRDFARAVELARGDYCWLFCDDDLIKPGAIQTVLEAIKNHDYALIIANSEVRNADLSKVLEPRRLPLRENRIYKASESQLLLSDIAQYISFIGCVIIKRHLWEIREKESYFGSYFIHVGVIFQQPLPGDTLALAEPSIAIRYANASWLARYFEIWMFKWPSVIWSFTGFSDAVKSRVVPKEPWRNLKTLLHYRAKGAYTKREYAELVKPRLASRWAQGASRASAHFPGRIANLIFVIYYLIFVNLPSRSLFLLDLANSPFCFWRFSIKTRTPLKSMQH